MASDLQKMLLSTVLRQNRNDTTSPTNAFNLNSTAVQAYLTQKLKGILPNATGNITENELMTAWLLANSGGGSGTVTSVDITTNAGAITITGNPITTAGAIDLDFNGANTDYIDGEGNAQPFPTIPSGTVTNVAALTLGTSGTDLSSTVANPTTTPVITLNVPTASALNRGALSAADWAVFNNKQDKSIVINSNTTAVLDGVYTVVASATFTDPTPAEGKGFMVFVRNGTATVGGTGYSTAGTVINRIFHSGAWANYTSSSFTPSALTKIDDTNVTLTLGGTPSTALLQAASLTLGWSGQLAISRGGTGLGTLGTALQQLRVNAGGTALEYFTPSAGSGLTIGTTPITGGTVGRVLFEGSGNVLQQNAILNLDTTNGLIIGGATARGTRLTLVNAADTLASKTLVIRNAADSSETFSITGNGIVNIGVANANSDVITLAGASWFRATNSPSTNQFQSLGFGNVITNVNVYSNVFGHNNTLVGANSNNNNLFGFNNVIRGTVVDCNIFGQYFDVIAGSTRINAIGRRINSTNTRGIQGTDLTFIGYSLEVNTINLSTNIITYFNNQNISHAIRKGGNIALLGEKYQILQDNTGTASQRLSTYMELAATNTITIHNGTAPTGNIADAIQAYAADITAGNTAMHIRNENGDIVKLYAIGGWGTPTGTLTRTTFDTTTVTLSQLAERVAALISDLKTGQQLLKA